MPGAYEALVLSPWFVKVVQKRALVYDISFESPRIYHFRRAHHLLYSLCSADPVHYICNCFVFSLAMYPIIFCFCRLIAGK